MRRRQLLAAAACAPALGARAADVTRIVVAYPPGGVSDQVARLLAERLAPLVGHAVVVENRPGAGGGLALAQLALARPDGRTLGFAAISPLALSPHFGTPAPRVVPVSGVMHTPLLLVGTPGLAARSFEDMVKIARGDGEALRWATSGVATIGHLALEQVRRQLQLSLVHIPYTGGGPQLQDALAGRFELLSTNLAPLQLDYVRTGRLTPLALGAPQRSRLLPALPTFAELGCPDANLSSLFGLFAPEGTPRDAVERVNAACGRVLAQPEFLKVLAGAGNMAAAGSADAFARAIARASAINARLVATLRR
ncbi:tripartite tricarboxylate transporter substrate binding protein [Ramlibacter sp. USB13]|uniref:Tripartite tricarboxylate transporter substrate binding protein n=1 Tax=Ramlibacter cellulosilyticus TaxID=2764187 RepID=A0A923MRN8_9BURK|nr:tripartite tricarboxylate transporter substrate binding protein [Ramlibacter cellulosilyticus]MBC5784577.1 tripartite tricarboxylate transporter substrate binding protein [Ramlibacter cellulosilyticus]